MNNQIWARRSGMWISTVVFTAITLVFVSACLAQPANATQRDAAGVAADVALAGGVVAESIVAGAEGATTLSLDGAGGASVGASSSLPAAVSVAPAAVPVAPAAAANATATPVTVRCTVQVPTLNLRSGPSTAFTPPLAQLANGAVLTARARNPQSSWIQVRVNSSGREGWVSAASQYVTCSSAVSRLPVAANIPAPPLPTVVAMAPLPNGADPNNDILGDLVAPANVFAVRGSGDTLRAVYTSTLAMYLDLTQLPADATAVSVDLILYDRDSDGVYVDSTRTAEPYCFFGFTGSQCNVIPLVAGARWPNGDLIENGLYRYSANVDVDEGAYARNWNGTLEIDSAALDSASPPEPAPPEPAPPDPLPAPPVLVILPPGPGGGPNDLTGNLVASPDEVTVYTNEFGASIMRFEDRIALGMEITGLPAGREPAYVEFSFIDDVSLEEVERGVTDVNEADNTFSENPLFCAFGNEESGCTSISLEEGARWPSTGIAITNGYYRFAAQVYLDDNSHRPWGGVIEIRNDALPPDPAEGGATDTGGGSDTGGGGDTGEAATPVADTLAPEAALVETAPGTTDDYVVGELAFRVAAWDGDVGYEDGDGIDSVYLEVVDPDGNVVHSRTEGTAGYCAFSGGEPDCQVYNFADNDYAWPSGDAILSGEYLLYAYVAADDGGSSEWYWWITIE